MLKKSTSAARWSADATAAGTSIMIPTGTSVRWGMPGSGQFGGGLGQQRLGVEDLVHGGDHGEHDMQIAVNRRAQQRPQLAS